MDFEKVCTIFSMQEPYYGILLSAMDRFPTNKIPTMGVCRSGNVFRLGYNPDFVADKSLEQLLAYLKHETLHIAFNHFTIFNTEAKTYAEHEIRNIATDLEVNSYVQFPDSDKDLWYFPKDFGWENCLGTMEYYNRIKQRNKEKQQKRQQSKPQRERKKNMLDGLDEIENKIIVMNRIQKKTISQISQELQIDEALVKQYLRNARMKVRQNIMSYGN